MPVNKLTLPQKQTLLQLKKRSSSALIRDRAQAVLTRFEGFTIKETSRALQRSETFVKDSLERFQNDTLHSIRLTSHNRKLSPKDRAAIIKSIQTKTPKDVGFNTPFWTMKIVKEWMKKTYGIEYKDEKSYRQLFAQAGFTFHKPKPVDYRQDRGKLKSFKGALKKSSVSTRLGFSW